MTSGPRSGGALDVGGTPRHAAAGGGGGGTPRHAFAAAGPSSSFGDRSVGPPSTVIPPTPVLIMPTWRKTFGHRWKLDAASSGPGTPTSAAAAAAAGSGGAGPAGGAAAATGAGAGASVGLPADAALALVPSVDSRRRWLGPSANGAAGSDGPNLRDVAGSVAVKLLMDLYLAERSASLVLGSALLRGLLASPSPSSRASAFELLLNFAAHSSLIAAAGPHAGPGAPPQAPGVGKPGGGAAMSPQEQQAAAEAAPGWARALLFECLLALKHAQEPTEEVWSAALSATLFLCCKQGRLQLSRIRSLAPEALRGLLDATERYGWSPIIRGHLLRAAAALVYDPSPQQAAAEASAAQPGGGVGMAPLPPLPPHASRPVFSEARLRALGGAEYLAEQLASAPSAATRRALLAPLLDSALAAAARRHAGGAADGGASGARASQHPGALSSALSGSGHAPSNPGALAFLPEHSQAALAAALSAADAADALAAAAQLAAPGFPERLGQALPALFPAEADAGRVPGPQACAAALAGLSGPFCARDALPAALERAAERTLEQLRTDATISSGLADASGAASSPEWALLAALLESPRAQERATGHAWLFRLLVAGAERSAVGLSAEQSLLPGRVGRLASLLQLAAKGERGGAGGARLVLRLAQRLLLLWQHRGSGNSAATFATINDALALAISGVSQADSHSTPPPADASRGGRGGTGSGSEGSASEADPAEAAAAATQSLLSWIGFRSHQPPGHPAAAAGAFGGVAGIAGSSASGPGVSGATMMMLAQGDGSSSSGGGAQQPPDAAGAEHGGAGTAAGDLLAGRMYVPLDVLKKISLPTLQTMFAHMSRESLGAGAAGGAAGAHGGAGAAGLARLGCTALPGQGGGPGVRGDIADCRAAVLLLLLARRVAAPAFCACFLSLYPTPPS